MKNKPKIVKVVTNSNAFLWHISSTVKYLSKQYDVIIIGDDVNKYRKEFKGVSFIDIEIKRKPSFFKDLIALINLIYHLIRLKPQLVHSIMPKAGFLTAIAAFISRVPIRLHTFTGQVWSKKRGMIRYILKLFDKIIVKLNTECLTDSFSQAKFLKNELHIKKSFMVINYGSICGVDMEKVKNVLHHSYESRLHELREKNKINREDFIFCYMARKTKDKGAVDMIEIFTKLKEESNQKMKLLYIGPYEERNTSKYINENYSFDQIIDINLVDNHLDYFAISNVVCLPSYREGFGNIIIEAGAFGVPSVGYDIIGLRDSICHNKTGILCPLGDKEKFGQLMNKLMSNDDYRNMLGRNSKENVHTKFTSEELSKGYNEYYNQLIKSVI